MKMLLHVKIPNKAFNTAVRDGSSSNNIKRIIDETQPESIYFTEYSGKRGAVIVADVDNPSEIPRLAEPWFLLFDAEVEFRVAMTPEELEKANIRSIAEKWH